MSNDFHPFSPSARKDVPELRRKRAASSNPNGEAREDALKGKKMAGKKMKTGIGEDSQERKPAVRPL
jgi:hypothetical protein